MACAEDPVNSDPEPEYIALQPDSVELLVGDTIRITAPTASSQGRPLQMPGTWSSSDSLVAQIDSTGLLVAKRGGDALVTFEASGLVGHAEVDVANRPLGAVTWQGVAAGCGIRREYLFCWDWTAGTLTPPQQVGAPQKFIEVDRGPAHTCAIARADRRIYCWGSNRHGQLGDGTTTDRHEPTAIARADIYTDVSVGPAHTCAMAAQAVAYCWGSDADGQLGVGGSTELCSGEPCRTRPTLVQLPRYAVRIDAGGMSDAGATCAITSDRQSYCWGTNANGILGNGAALPGDGAAGVQPTPQPVTGGHRFWEIAVGGEHACAATFAGRLYCWGANASGQRGTGDGGAAISAPAEITRMDGAAVDVVAGDAHTCARLWHGGVQCWGSNSANQVSPAGAGSPDVVQLPQDVIGSRTFVQIAARDDRTCGITTTHEVVCWGGGITPMVLPDPAG